MRTRVLHVVLNLDEGGLERVVAELIKRMDPDRFDSRLLAVEYLGRCADGLERFGDLHVAPAQSRWSMLRPRELARLIRQIAPDIVHTHSGIWFKGALAARIAGVAKLVHTDHGRKSPDPLSDRIVDYLASRRTDVVVAVSDALARDLATVVSKRTRIRVIHNGVDTMRFAPARDDGALRREIGIADEVPILGSIGRLDWIKGYDVMLNALALARSGWSESQGPAPMLVIAGDGPERQRLIDESRRLGIDGAVHFIGWREDIHALHSAFTLFTLASRSEGTSIGLLEAMSSGLCPVVTNVGGNGAVLGAALRHRLCAPEDAAALAHAWVEALKARDRLAEDGAQARRTVLRKFSIDAMVRAYAAIYAGSASSVPLALA